MYASRTRTEAVEPDISHDTISRSISSPFSFGEGSCDSTKAAKITGYLHPGKKLALPFQNWIRTCCQNKAALQILFFVCRP